MMKFTEKAPRKLGLYVHIPFCRSKCLYCDFCSLVGRTDEADIYIDALCREIVERGAETDGYTVDTVYFGGGTPSLLTSGQLLRIFDSIRDNFLLSYDAEITLECNPITHLSDGAEYFKSILSLGVNRLSLGVQSACDAELKLIGRRHTFAEAKKTFTDARQAGFRNISVDLMLGLPSQTRESLESSVGALVSLSPEHISIYSLQLEEGTPLYRMRDRYDIPDDDTAADMYESVVAMLKEAGYLHYEISNFAKEGRESRHNKKYWSLDEYIGVGLAAHSDFSGERIENTSDMQKYLSGERIEAKNRISERERAEEYIMLGLRTLRGISESEYFSRFGESLDKRYGEKMRKYEALGLLLRCGDGIRLSERGFEVSNTILSELLNFDY